MSGEIMNIPPRIVSINFEEGWVTFDVVSHQPFQLFHQQFNFNQYEKKRLHADINFYSAV
jgi:hypothetical protein